MLFNSYYYEKILLIFLYIGVHDINICVICEFSIDLLITNFNIDELFIKTNFAFKSLN